MAPPASSTRRCGTGRVRGEHGRSVCADAEERGAAEVQDAGVAELDGEAKAGEDVEQHRRHHQQREVIAVEERRDRDAREHGADVQQQIVPGERRLHLASQPSRAPATTVATAASSRPATAVSLSTQRNRMANTVSAAIAPAPTSGAADARSCLVFTRVAGTAQTRSLSASAIRPVGRQAMIAITTANANTSLYALANGRATAPIVCSAANRKPPRMAP